MLSSASIVFLALYAGMVQGACKKFVETGTDVPEGFKSSLRPVSRVSPGIACGKPGLTTQSYGGTTRQLCGPHSNSCGITGAGNVALLGATNMTASQKKQLDETEVIELMIKDSPSLQNVSKHHGPTGLDFSKNITTSIATRVICMNKGTNGWLEWRPKAFCSVGHMDGCSGKGKALEGTSISVCVPAALGNSFPPIPAAKVTLVKSSASEAAKKKGNPSLRNNITPPSAASTVEMSASLVVGAVAALGALCIV